MPSPPRPENAQAGSVFLSYSRSDLEASLALRGALESAGLSVFRDQDAIRAGDRWLTRLEEALQGCSTFVVLVGRDGVRRWVGAEVQVALNRHLSPHDDAQRLPIFPVLLPEAGPESLPPFLALFQVERWSPPDPLPTTLAQAVAARATRFDERHRFEGCPFPGLSAFQRGDAALFFGRRRETLEALACLGDQQQANPETLRGGGGGAYCRWLQIEGNSGSGKSSLVNAGMLPMIEQGALWARTGFERWRVIGPMMPGTDPLANLASAFEQALIADPARRDSLRRLERLKSDERALAFALKDFGEVGTAFLLVVDQFEELFTFAEDESRKRFDALLAHALQDPDCPLFVISTVRADFLDRYERLPRLQGIYNSHCKRYFLPTISEHGLREVIEQPARIAGLDVGEVTTAILDDARDEAGALPLVENALYTLWQDRAGNRLSGERYRKANGIAGMLSTQADALLERIDKAVPKGKQAALELLLRLTRINDEGRHTRQRITREEAVLIAGEGKDEAGERVLRMLSGERSLDAPGGGHQGTLRLLTISEEQSRRYVDLIHETLVRARSRDEKTGKRIGYWPTLYDYVEANRDRDIHRQQLDIQAERWLRSRGMGRVWKLAFLDYGNYRLLRVPADTPQGRFLRWSRRARWGLSLFLALLTGYVGESYHWTRKHDLPLDSMWTLQRYRFGHAPLPQMVAIRPGAVDMGEHDAEFMKGIPAKYHPNLGFPGTHAEVPKGFRLGKYEVTYEEFDYYAWERGDVTFPTTAKGGRGSRPVVNVNWHDASAYAQWLGDRTGLKCRLPTEAEWEYAARANTLTAYPWSDEVGANRANCNGCGSPWDSDQSAPVGSFPNSANAFGLEDVSGNVWEWSCSAWREKFDGSERQCADKDNTELRAFRGGSWGDDPALARLAARDNFGPGNRSDDFGFRVLCASPME